MFEAEQFGRPRHTPSLFLQCLLDDRGLEVLYRPVEGEVLIVQASAGKPPYGDASARPESRNVLRVLSGFEQLVSAQVDFRDLYGRQARAPVLLYKRQCGEARVRESTHRFGYGHGAKQNADGVFMRAEPCPRHA